MIQSYESGFKKIVLTLTLLLGATQMVGCGAGMSEPSALGDNPYERNPYKGDPTDGILQAEKGPPSNWWNTDWRVRHLLSPEFAATKDNLENFPVLVRISGADLEQDFINHGSDEIRFATFDGSKSLPFEVVDWNPSGVSLFWVQLPSFSDHSQWNRFWVYYGYKDSSTAPDSQDSYSFNPWNDVYVGVYHFQENLQKDSSRWQQDLTISGSPSLTSSGFIGNAAELNDLSGDNDSLGLLSHSQASSLDTWTFEALIRADNTSSESWIYGAHSDLSASNPSLEGIYLDGGVLEFMNFWDLDNSSNFSLIPSASYGPAVSDWTHIVASFERDTGKAHLYADGIVVRESTLPAGSNTIQDFIIGTHPLSSLAFQGRLDELRILAKPLSPSWIHVQYEMYQDSQFVDVESAEILWE
jgi:hypothetical protein